MLELLAIITIVVILKKCLDEPSDGKHAPFFLDADGVDYDADD